MEATRSYLKSIGTRLEVRGTPIRVEPLSAITPRDLLRAVDKEATPRDSETGGAFKLRDEDETGAQVTGKDRTSLSPATAEAAQTISFAVGDDVARTVPSAVGDDVARTIPSAVGDGTTQSIILVIDLDPPVLPTVRIETEVEVREELVSEAVAAKAGEVVEP